ncbi:MAG: LytTR family DNA-binding domain-containing protein [Peptococcaceae bacterium]
MRFAICDDERVHINELENYFAQKENVQIETEPFESGEALLDAYKQRQQSFDALFIDLEMGGMNGIETANAIRAIDERVIIVFVTSHEEYAIDCFQCSPLRFLKKPLQPEKVDEALWAIVHLIESKRETISFVENKEYVRLYCDEIIYCEGSRNTVIMYTAEGAHQVRMTLTEAEKALSPNLFCRCHKGYLVNVGCIKKIVGQDIVLRHCETTLPIGRAYKTALKAALVDYEERRFY